MKRLVLLGGGHAHVHVLKALGDALDPTVSVTLVTVNAALPVFEIVAVSSLFEPTLTVAKPRLAGVRAMLGAGGMAPVADSDTLTVGVSGSLLVITRLPASAPAPVGAYWTASVTELLAAMLNGVVGGDCSENSAVPVAERLLTTSAALPVFDTVTVSVLLAPMLTEPNASVVGETVMFGTAATGKSEALPGNVRAVISARLVNPSPSLSPGSATASSPPRRRSTSARPRSSCAPTSAETPAPAARCR